MVVYDQIVHPVLHQDAGTLKGLENTVTWSRYKSNIVIFV